MCVAARAFGFLVLRQEVSMIYRSGD
jgi:hypothetical protein